MMHGTLTCNSLSIVTAANFNIQGLFLKVAHIAFGLVQYTYTVNWLYIFWVDSVKYISKHYIPARTFICSQVHTTRVCWAERDLGVLKCITTCVMWLNVNIKTLLLLILWMYYLFKGLTTGYGEWNVISPARVGTWLWKSWERLESQHWSRLKAPLCHAWACT